jgi:hypothetical protein
MAESQAQDAQIWSDLKSLGLNDSAAAGVMGNMMQESSMNPSEAGGGLMQWINGRWDALVSYARSRGVDPNSVTAQVGYFGQELSAGNEGITLQSLNAAGSPQAAALLVSTKFERPDPRKANNAHRESAAAGFYNEFSGKTVPGGDLSGLTQTSASSGSKSSAPTAQGSNGYPSGSDIIGIIDQSLSMKDFNILHPGQSLAQDAGAIALRTVLVIVGLILFIFGMVAIVEKATGGAVPVPV